MEVARSVGPSAKSHELKTLDGNKSWDLFTKVVFPGEKVEEVCTGKLKDLGKEIVENCGGLPLALVVMGGLLFMKERSIRAWEKVKEGFNWQESSEGEASLKILALSYEALPHHLKSCFLYFSSFPEDFGIDADKLVRLWVAEGFVPDEEKKQHGRMGRTMEEIAEGWLEDLVQRCLVQVVDMSPSGRVKKCRIHDLLLKVAIKEGEEVNFFHTWQGSAVDHISPPNTTRRLALHQVSMERELTSPEFCPPKLRTFLGIGSYIESLQFIKTSELLRVLDLEGVLCENLPRSIGDLIHLRYLGLRGKKLCSIPSSIRRLRHLQTFDVGMSHRLINLPKSVWGIRTLRHVLIDIKIRIEGKLDQLVNLQTLKYAQAGSWMQKSLAMMRNLRVLTICDIKPTHHHALAESLDSMLHLRSLFLSSGSIHFPGETPLPRKALALPKHRHLEKLTLLGPLLGDHPENKNGPPPPPNYSSDELPPNLYKLQLLDTRLQQDPWSLLEKLPHLRCLVMKWNAYVGEEAVCSAGGFPQLESLEVSYLGHLKRWRVAGDGGAMPRLNRLQIIACNHLEEVPPQLENVSTLNIEHNDLRKLWFVDKVEGQAGSSN